MGWSIKKPLGGKNSFVRRNVKNPGPALIGGTLLGPGGAALGSVLTDIGGNFKNKAAGLEDRSVDATGDIDALAAEEEAKRRELGLKQRDQINEFAGDVEGRAAGFRTGLAESLANTGQQFFEKLNPAILEDLNARGLFTSQTARDTEQNAALKDIALENQKSLRGFDTDIFNQVNDIRGTALSALLGGDQSALDAALGLRKAKIQRRFDEQDAQREQNFSEMLARRQSRDGLISSLLGLAGRAGAAAF